MMMGAMGFAPGMMNQNAKANQVGFNCPPSCRVSLANNPSEACEVERLGSRPDNGPARKGPSDSLPSCQSLCGALYASLNSDTYRIDG